MKGYFWIFKIPLIPHFARLWGSFFRHNISLKDIGGTNLWQNCQISRKRNAHIYIIILCQIKCWNYSYQADMRVKLQNLSSIATPFGPPPPSCIWKKPKLFTNASPCSDFSNIIDQCRFFFTSGMGFNNLMNVLEDCIIFLNWAAWF